MSRPLYRGCPLFGGSVIRGFTVPDFASAYSAYSTTKQQITQACIIINKLCMYIHVHIMPLSQVGMCIFACVNAFVCLCTQCILHIYTLLFASVNALHV